ncbi:hypothetical protein GCM10020218_008870 [Dactylosporangium vinaceum]
MHARSGVLTRNQRGKGYAIPYHFLGIGSFLRKGARQEARDRERARVRIGAQGAE